MNAQEPYTRKQSQIIAFKAVLAVACFALAAIGLVAAIEIFGPHAEQKEFAVEYAPSYEPFYVLLIGNDSRKETALYTGKASDHAQLDQHADIATLVRVDPQTYTITLVSVPRDTWIDDLECKLSETLVKGDPQDSVDAVERITGIKADYYIMTTFNGFRDLIDAVGGVTVDVPITVAEDDPVTAKTVTVTSGESQNLNGSKALVFARSRKEYGEYMEALRQVNVRNIEASMINTVLNEDVNIFELLSDLERTTSTNMSYELLGYMLNNFVQHKNEITLYSCTGPHKGDFDKSKDGLWVVKQDDETWTRIRELVEAGESASEIVYVPPFPGNNE